jgi:hypothetical protein
MGRAQKHARAAAGLGRVCLFVGVMVFRSITCLVTKMFSMVFLSETCFCWGDGIPKYNLSFCLSSGPHIQTVWHTSGPPVHTLALAYSIRRMSVILMDSGGNEE